MDDDVSGFTAEFTSVSVCISTLCCERGRGGLSFGTHGFLTMRRCCPLPPVPIPVPLPPVPVGFCWMPHRTLCPARGPTVSGGLFRPLARTMSPTGARAVAAYERAIEEGAGFIETDILSSKDGVLICFHDVTLDDTTDIALHKEFAYCRRTYIVEGVTTTGFVTVDFTLKELKTLRVKQRYPFRDQQYNGKFSIITFEEYIMIALNAKRVVGIYPEIKNPVFINERVKWSNGRRFEDAFVDTLKKYGYKGSYLSQDWLKQPMFIQSFAPTSLIYTSKLTDSLKIFLIDDVTVTNQDTNQSYWEITSDKYFSYIKNYVVGIGPWKDTIVPVVGKYLQSPTNLIARAHAHNLQVHPYSYRNENQFLAFNFHQDPYQEYNF
ncbi:hypothetical protein MLD38_025016 [Melastoma candidum]|uniref:Uncharacterized protein n=1 Tax=Melastoma candidum TaxID=119954 RepID=A0ACB9NVS4_9MYRT|nr:hypothetical protein MLD38_025016 [Melastoma candidum]